MSQERLAQMELASEGVDLSILPRGTHCWVTWTSLSIRQLYVKPATPGCTESLDKSQCWMTRTRSVGQANESREDKEEP